MVEVFLFEILFNMLAKQEENGYNELVESSMLYSNSNYAVFLLFKYILTSSKEVVYIRALVKLIVCDYDRQLDLTANKE